MDGGALAAIGLVANILQFIDWVSHVCEIGSQIRRNGMSDSNIDLQQTLDELQGQITSIKSPDQASSGTKAEKCLAEVSAECLKISDELKTLLKTSLTQYQTIGKRLEQNQANVVAAQKNRGTLMKQKANSLGQAIRLEWKKDKIQKLSTKLDKCRKRLDAEVLMGVREMLIQMARTTDTNHAAVYNEVRTAAKQSASEAQRILQGQGEMVEIINTFLDKLRSHELFPDLPCGVYLSNLHSKPGISTGTSRVEDAILEALTFRMMLVREAEISATYAKTCNWIFEDPVALGKPWANFQAWLREGDGIYWIGGKAGSGKSTLVKYISTHAKTIWLLRTWAGESELVLGSYFFWLAGTPLQKNQEGLLRSLLHTVLAKRRDLIPRIFPHFFTYDTWITRKFASYDSPKVVYQCQYGKCCERFDQPEEIVRHLLHQHQHSPDLTRTIYELDDLHNLSLIELRRAFLALAKEDLSGVKICLFVDGLDEFEGLPEDILTLFEEATKKSPTLKMVLSSRPETDFKEAFSGVPSLQLEDLTCEDIRLYCTESLTSNARMRRDMTRDPIATANLLSAITSRASGVFLWVVLVVRSLLQGLKNGTYLNELEAIVYKCPSELTDLYSHMFGRMKSDQRLESSRIFQCVMNCLEVEQDLPSVQRLSYMDLDEPFSATQVPVKFMSVEDLFERCSVIEDRLRSRCCGLLEVVHDQTSTETNKDVEGSRIRFLHRSVLDFLKEPKMMANMQSDTAGTRFDASEHNMASFLFCLKSWHFFHLKNRRQWKPYVQQLRYFWAYFEQSGNVKSHEYLRPYMVSLDMVLTKLWKKPAFTAMSTCEPDQLPEETRGWVQSMIHTLQIASVIQHDDADPMLTLISRYGSLPSFQEQWSLGHISRDRKEIQCLMIRLVSWLMSSESSNLRTKHMLMFEFLLQHGSKEISLPSGRCIADDTGDVTTHQSIPVIVTPWKFLLKQTPLQLDLDSSEQRVIFAKSDENTRVDIFENWANLIVKCLDSGARLSKSCEDTIKERLRPVAMSTGFLSVYNRDRVESLNGHIKHALEIGRKEQQKHRGKPVTEKAKVQKLHSTPPASDSATLLNMRGGPVIAESVQASCGRCKAIEALAEMGFSIQEIFRALDAADIGNDVPGLIAWLSKNTYSESFTKQANGVNSHFPPLRGPPTVLRILPTRKRG